MKSHQIWYSASHGADSGLDSVVRVGPDEDAEKWMGKESVAHHS